MKTEPQKSHRPILSKNTFNIILPSLYAFTLSGLIPSGFPSKNPACNHFFCLSYMPHAQPISSPFVWLPKHVTRDTSLITIHSSYWLFQLPNTATMSIFTEINPAIWSLGRHFIGLRSHKAALFTWHSSLMSHKNGFHRPKTLLLSQSWIRYWSRSPSFVSDASPT